MKTKQNLLLNLNHNGICFYNETDLQDYDPEGLHSSNTTTSVNFILKIQL